MRLVAVTVDVWVPLVTFAFGVVVTFGLEAIRRKWSREDAAVAFAQTSAAERRGRVEARSMEAAGELLRIFGLVRAKARDYASDDQFILPEGTEEAIPRHGVYLINRELRTRVERISELYAFLPIMEFPEPSDTDSNPRTSVFFFTASWAIEALGAMVREEPMPDSEYIDRCLKDLDRFQDEDYRELQQRLKEEEASGEKSDELYREFQEQLKQQEAAGEKRHESSDG
jgi:hypothetical protein